MLSDPAIADRADTPAPQPEFFISRAGPDSVIAQRIAHILEDAGHRTLIQDWDFKNRAFMERMQAALTCGARTIALLSPDYLTRDHCAAEWQNTIADDPLNRDSRLIVLCIRPCAPVGLLKSLAYWDLVPLLSAPDQEAMLRDVVLASVRSGRRKDALSPATRFFEAAKPLLSNEIKPVPHFTGRDDQLRAIGEALAQGRGAAITQPAAVHGLGGVGKSTLAREFAARAAESGRYSGIWWLRAERTKDARAWDGIEQGLGELRATLYPGIEPPKERAEAARAMLRFLSTGGFEKPWLLVYDNVDDEEVLEEWAPPAGVLVGRDQTSIATQVQVLITSRLSAWGGGVARVEVEEWPLPDAVRYLREASGRDDLADADLTAIAERLGCLPLALSHAAAYLRRRRTVTADAYLAELTLRMNEVPRGAAYKAPVFATFNLAIEQAEAEAPGARGVLAFASFLAPDDIPEELYGQEPDIYPLALREVAASKARLDEAIAALDYLSLVDFDPGSRTFSVHRLVQAAARDALRGTVMDVEAEWMLAAINACNVAVPHGDFQYWPAYERLFPHTRCIADQASEAFGAPLAQLLNAAGYHLDDCSEYAQAEPLYVRAMAIRENVLGSDHPDVAQSLNNLAALYVAQGAYAKAEPLHARALTIFENALGPGHSLVATSLNNLAALHHARGAYAQVEPLHARALAIREKALGPDHPDVARSLNNLATLHRDLGAYAKAEPLHARALSIREKALGSEHPDVAQSLNNLALLYYVQGANAEAEPLHARALAIRENALGPDHPDVATSLNNLAALRHEQGAYAHAEPLYVRALAICEKALGPDHPDVALSLNNLAALHYAQGAYAQAEPLYARALAIWEKVLGPDHTNTQTEKDNLAALRRAMDGANASQQAAPPSISRNSPCPCGSGKRYKHCCGAPHFSGD